MPTFIFEFHCSVDLKVAIALKIFCLMLSTTMCLRFRNMRHLQKLHVT